MEPTQSRLSFEAFQTDCNGRSKRCSSLPHIRFGKTTGHVIKRFHDNSETS